MKFFQPIADWVDGSKTYLILVGGSIVDILAFYEVVAMRPGTATVVSLFFNGLAALCRMLAGKPGPLAP